MEKEVLPPENRGRKSYTEMSLLEWFAGMALLSNINTDNWTTINSLAEMAFNIAQAMIAESEKRSR